MEDHASVTDDMLELLHLNQTALRAGLEELPLWIKQRGSTNVHGNVLSIMHTPDTNAEAIASGIQSLRLRYAAKVIRYLIHDLAMLRLDRRRQEQMVVYKVVALKQIEQTS
ncbi:hypothetical protein ACIPW4_16080 [Pseudomonas sp. NPDC089996]|uniref:hypothetical protein n=1 Tax=Pseudomonas sp. NPDC089996 TaxID=3364474 RepID=UPI0037FEB718